MVSTNHKAADRLLEAFFPETDGPRKGALDPWIDRLRIGRTTILPARGPAGNARLYALSPSVAAARGFSEELSAAIGPSWSDFMGVPSELDDADPIEHSILEYVEKVGGGPTYRIEVREDRAAWDAMRRMMTSWRRRPNRPDAGLTLTPLADVLRDVELALQTSAIAEAEHLIDALRRRGELSSQNLLFLELRLLASSGHWGEVLQHPRLDDVLNAHRPAGVTSMLFEAIDERLLAAPAAARDAKQALRVFDERIANRFRSLLESGGQNATAAARRVALLNAVSEGATVADALAMCDGANTAELPWLEAIARLGSEPKPDEPSPELSTAATIETAREAYYAGRYRQALELLADIEPTQEVIALLLWSAIGVGGLAAAQVVAAAFYRLDPDEQRRALEALPLKGSLEDMLALGSDSQQVKNWRQWITRLNSDAAFDAAVDIAELGASEWSSAEPASDPEAQELADALRDLTEQRRSILETSLPHLLLYLDRRPKPDDLAGPVYAAVLDVLAYGTSRTPAVREAALTVLERLLDGTPSAGAYEDQLSLVTHIWDDVRSPLALGWLVDVLAVLVHSPCPAPRARSTLIGRALADAIALRDVDTVDTDVLRLVATDPVLAGEFEDEVARLPEFDGQHDEANDEPDVVLGPLTIGIYTLSEPAAHRAKAALEGRYPSLDVQLNHEHDDSERLRGLARRADVMAVVVASAKHAATESINRNCRPEALLEVGTAGSTGLIRAVRERLQELVAA
jgi:hypothetical protein